MEIYTTGIVTTPKSSARSTKDAGQFTADASPDRHLASRESNLSELWSKSPFEMPPDEDVLKLRSMEKDKLKEQKRKDNLLPIAEKITFASKLGSTRWSKELRQDMFTIDDQIAKEMERIRSVTILPVEHYHKEKENMSEFIAKKREIFLVQMSLDTKRAEIRKLEDKIFQREEALRKSEEMLAEDGVEFDEFLKKNDEKVQEAIRKAEQQTRLKQDKVAEAKRLSSTISSLRRDLNKYKEQLDECRKYKDFLVGITPKEWFEERERIRVEQERKDAEEAAAAAAVAAEAAAKDGEAPGAAAASEDAAGSIAGGAAESTSEALTDEALADEEAAAMYFRRPVQLLELFSELEEKNLTLMQECQDSENALEDLRSNLSETRASNDAKIANLRIQLQTLRASLRAEDESQTRLQNKTILNMVDRKYDISSEDIMAKVAEVYARCGFEIDPSLGVIQMLTNIESRLEENVLGLEGISNDVIEQTEKSREKDRRLKIRAERLDKVREEQERRALRSLERSQAPVHKRVGKPVMFRSFLKKKRREIIYDESKSSDDKELLDFLARAY